MTKQSTSWLIIIGYVIGFTVLMVLCAFKLISFPVFITSWLALAIIMIYLFENKKVYKQ